MQRDKSLGLSSNPNGWVIQKGEIKAHCHHDEIGNKCVGLEIPFEELRYDDLSDLVEVVWRARAWLGDARKSLTKFAVAPNIIEPPSVIGLVRAKRILENGGRLQDLEDEIKRVVRSTKILP